MFVNRLVDYSTCSEAYRTARLVSLLLHPGAPSPGAPWKGGSTCNFDQVERYSRLRSIQSGMPAFIACDASQMNGTPAHRRTTRATVQTVSMFVATRSSTPA